MTSTSQKPLYLYSDFSKSLFDDPNFAWELLEWEIAIEMQQALSGQAIARLLELYMKGVEKMNSVLDFRESYFKNKVTSLMTKNTVVKSLSKPPMAKKEKPLQTNAHVEQVTAKQEIKNQASTKKESVVSSLVLQEKKKEIEMRLAYEAQETNAQGLGKLISNQLKKQQNFQRKVRGIMNSHQQKLQQRINRRKLKTATYRSRPDETNDTLQFADPDLHQRKREIQDGLVTPKLKAPPRCKSHQNRVKHELSINDSPKKIRKSTLDLTKQNEGGDIMGLVPFLQQKKQQ